MVATEVESTDEKTLGYIASKVFAQLRSLTSKPAWKIADFRSIVYSLYWLADAGHLVLFKDSNDKMIGVLAYDIESPWYSKFTCFEEIFVLGLDPSFVGFGRIALKWMKKKAKDSGCALFETGASMTDSPELLENLYKRHGRCTFSYPSFVWVLPN